MHVHIPVKQLALHIGTLYDRSTCFGLLHARRGVRIRVRDARLAAMYLIHYV